MSQAAHLFKITAAVALGVLLSAPLHAAEAVEYKKNPSGFARDVFDQNVYFEGTSYLRLERLYRKIFHKKLRAANVNLFDEVPDSGFFTNRHGKKALLAADLTAGANTGKGPDAAGGLTITRGKFEGTYPEFYVRDSKGDDYFLKFDPPDNLELATGAEAVASRFYHAIGYNVPEVDIFYFSPDIMTPGKDARVVDTTGFEKSLTKEKLGEYLLFIPWDTDGKFRSSATKMVKGDDKGGFFFDGRRKEDPDDLIDHNERRELRALIVFSAWLNNADLRQSNTLDVVENGALKHYLTNFSVSLGNGGEGVKAPMTGYEHMVDYGETMKAFLALGFWEKPWQKRWRENGEQVTSAPAVGYFDNNGFNPGKFKNQMPHYAFKDVTLADGFWAAKIIMAFSDDDVRALVKAGQYSKPEDADYISKTLIERRDLIGKYWFTKANPLDDFDMKAGELVFNDLAVKYGFAPKEGSTYVVDVIGKKAGRGKKILSRDFSSPSIPVEDGWFQGNDGVDILIRIRRPQSETLSPYVLVELDRRGVQGIIHQD